MNNCCVRNYWEPWLLRLNILWQTRPGKSWSYDFHPVTKRPEFHCHVSREKLRPSYLMIWWWWGGPTTWQKVQQCWETEQLMPLGDRLPLTSRHCHCLSGKNEHHFFGWQRMEVFLIGLCASNETRLRRMRGAVWRGGLEASRTPLAALYHEIIMRLLRSRFLLVISRSVRGRERSFVRLSRNHGSVTAVGVSTINNSWLNYCNAGDLVVGSVKTLLGWSGSDSRSFVY